MYPGRSFGRPCRQPGAPAGIAASTGRASAGRLSAEELRRVEDDAIRNVVRMQQEIGLQGVTDGEFRRSE